jgi:hypothetical protein
LKAVFGHLFLLLEFIWWETSAVFYRGLEVGSSGRRGDGETFMAWVTSGVDSLTDYWDVEIGNRRWYRKLDLASNAYLYRFEDQQAPHHSGLYGDANAVGLPGQIQGNTFAVDSSDRVQACFQALSGLTVSLAGTLKTIGAQFPLLQATAGQHENAANTAIPQAENLRQQAEQAADPASGRQKFRQAIRLLLDVHGNASAWATSGVALGNQRNPLLAITQRATALGQQAYQAL